MCVFDPGIEGLVKNLFAFDLPPIGDDQRELLTSIAEDSIRAMVSERRRSLDIRGVNIVSARHGLMGQRQRTFQELAGEYGISRTRPPQIYWRYIRKLRHPVWSSRLTDNLEWMGLWPEKSS